jgi:hypothetical protein
MGKPHSTIELSMERRLVPVSSDLSVPVTLVTNPGITNNQNPRQAHINDILYDASNYIP